MLSCNEWFGVSKDDDYYKNDNQLDNASELATPLTNHHVLREETQVDDLIRLTVLVYRS